MTQQLYHSGPINSGMRFTSLRQGEVFQVKGLENGIVTSFRPRAGDKPECHVLTMETWFRQNYQPRVEAGAR